MSPARWLLHRLLPDDERAVADELDESLAARFPRGGVRARLWYWRQALSLASRFWLERRRESRARPAEPIPATELSMSVLFDETRHALHSLRRRPGFALLVVLVLAVGIGPAVAIFTVVNGLLLRPLPYREPERLGLVRIDLSGLVAHPGIAQAEVLDLRADLGVAAGVEAVETERIATLGIDDDMATVLSARATPGLFDLLGVEPAYGRWMAPVDQQTAQEIVVSHDLWQRELGGDPARVGESLIIDGSEAVVVGVLPPGFRLLLGPGGGVSPNVELWRPLSLSPERRDYWGYRTLVRLAPGVGFARARADIAAFGERLIAAHPTTYESAGIRFDLSPLREDVVGPVRPAVMALLGAVVLVLLIACNNAAGLLLAGTLARAKELAVRQALGAGRARVLIQVLIESLALAGAAGTIGVLAARFGLATLLAYQPGNLPRVDDMVLDASVVGFAVGVTFLACLAFGLLPAWQSAQVAAGDVLRRDGRGSGGLSSGARNALVVAQVAFSVVLIVGAGLLIRTLERLGDVSLGFEPAHALAMHVPLDSGAFPMDQRWNEYADVLDRLRALPEVTAAGGLQYIPLDGRSFRSSYSADLDSSDEWNGTSADYRWIAPGTLEAMGIRLLAGRDLERADLDENRPVAIIDRSLAEQLWPDGDAVGRRLRIIVGAPGLPDPPIAEVIGVMEHPRIIDVRREVRPQIWMPYTVVPRADMAVVVRTTGDPLAAVASIRQAIHDAGTGRPVHTIRTLASLVADASAAARFALLLMSSLAAIALLLSAAGIYSLLAYLVRGRTQETGVRMALGARAADILRLNVLRGLRLAALGISLGVVGAVALAGYLESLLFEVAPRDPLTLAGAVALVAVIAVLASWLPARRASRMEPSLALRAR